VKEGLVEALEAAFGLGDLAKVEELLGRIEVLRPGELTPYVQAQGARFGARLAAARRDRDNHRDRSRRSQLIDGLLDGQSIRTDRQASGPSPQVEDLAEIFGPVPPDDGHLRILQDSARRRV
jgi:hypothetical protein